ncbi:MAG: GNAT family N-acetyltransferase [Saprospiraceae bacterium]
MVKDLSFDFRQNILLEDERALLRPMETDDAETLWPFAVAEPDLWQYSLQQPNTPEAMRKYVQLACDARLAGKVYAFVAFDKASGKPAGSTRFYDIDLHHKCCTIGFTWYGAGFRGSGLNTHCKQLLLDYAFKTVGFERVEFRSDARNARSIRAMEKIGAVREGTLRSNCTSPEGRRDSAVLSILKGEWEH